MNRTILYLDDDQACLNVFRHTFGREFEVLTASQSSEAFNLLLVHRADIIISDQIMPDMLGTGFLRDVAMQYPASYRVLLTGSSTVGSFVPEITKGIIHQFLTKPWSAQEVKQMCERALAWRRGASGAELSAALNETHT